MIDSKRLVCLLCSVALVQGLGCASSYNRYSECEVNCQYCEPAPLSYPSYCDCVCHSAAATRYLTRFSPPTSTESRPVPEVPNDVLRDNPQTAGEVEQQLLGIIKPVSQVLLE